METHGRPEDAWDIDKERDAVMYKRESLERLLQLTPKEESRPPVCAEAAGGVPLGRGSEGQGARAQADVRGRVRVCQRVRERGGDQTDGCFRNRKRRRSADGALARRCVSVRVGDRSLGWFIEDNPDETVGQFYALLTSRLTAGKRDAEQGKGCDPKPRIAFALRR